MNDEQKKKAAERAVDFIKDGDIVGLGTGSTAKFAIEAIAGLIREGRSIRGVPTSLGTMKLAQDLGIPLLDLNDVERINITLDGADEVDPGFNMIKGGGGALTREKLVALASSRRVILIDETKLVPALGSTRGLPVEVLPFAWRMAQRSIAGLGSTPILRLDSGRPFVSDNGNYILDCEFGKIDDPPSLETQIKVIPGVIESGLFVGIADALVIGFDDRVEVRERGDRQ